MNTIEIGLTISQVHKATRNGTATVWMALNTSTSCRLRNIQERIIPTSNDRKIYLPA